MHVTHESRILIVKIPTNVQWKNEGRRAKLTYSVEISIKDGELLRSTAGSCWEHELKVCAADILADTQTAIDFPLAVEQFLPLPAQLRRCSRQT